MIWSCMLVISNSVGTCLSQIRCHKQDKKKNNKNKQTDINQPLTILDPWAGLLQA